MNVVVLVGLLIILIPSVLSFIYLLTTVMVGAIKLGDAGVMCICLLLAGIALAAFGSVLGI